MHGELSGDARCSAERGRARTFLEDVRGSRVHPCSGESQMARTLLKWEIETRQTLMKRLAHFRSSVGVQNGAEERMCEANAFPVKVDDPRGESGTNEFLPLPPQRLVER